MRQKAQFLLDEAATWSLLWYLYGKGNQPLSSNTSLLEIDVVMIKCSIIFMVYQVS